MTIFQCDATQGWSVISMGPCSLFHQFPKLTRNVHWLLGVFHLRDQTLTIYDSLLESGNLEKDRTEVIFHINVSFDIWLHINGYYADKPLKMSFPFKVVYPDTVPQHSGILGDFGVWVCIFIERLINKQPIYQQEDTAMAAYQMRQRMAILFYDSLLSENFEFVSTCQKLENDLEVEVV